MAELDDPVPSYGAEKNMAGLDDPVLSCSTDNLAVLDNPVLQNTWLSSLIHFFHKTLTMRVPPYFSF